MATSRPTHPLTPASSDSQPAADTAKPGRSRRIVVAFAALALAAATALAVAGSGASASAGAPPDGPSHEHHASRANDIVFGPAPPLIPPGAEIAVLQGDPSVPGQEFTIRLRFPDGWAIGPHSHPNDENVTVIKGKFLIGMGDVFDTTALLALRAGDFITAPANANHFAEAKGRTVIQIHGIGPFEVTYVNPEDDPRNQQ
jgi:quercetin dioxygenase-like cupin family protein